MDRSELVSALRQADGMHVQILLMVRDDFWMGISRLFETLEISLDPEQNTRAVDLFDLQHARRVLYLFGGTLGRFSRAIDRREASASDLNTDQRNFLDQAVHELSEDGRVISVRLSLFADLMKERPWTLASLLEVGGAAGVAVRFLDLRRRSALAPPCPSGGLSRGMLARCSTPCCPSRAPTSKVTCAHAANWQWPAASRKVPLASLGSCKSSIMICT